MQAAAFTIISPLILALEGSHRGGEAVTAGIAFSIRQHDAPGIEIPLRIIRSGISPVVRAALRERAKYLLRIDHQGGSRRIILYLKFHDIPACDSIVDGNIALSFFVRLVGTGDPFSDQAYRCPDEELVLLYTQLLLPIVFHGDQVRVRAGMDYQVVFQHSPFRVVVNIDARINILVDNALV